MVLESYVTLDMDCIAIKIPPSVLEKPTLALCPPPQIIQYNPGNPDALEPTFDSPRHRGVVVQHSDHISNIRRVLGKENAGGHVLLVGHGPIPRRGGSVIAVERDIEREVVVSDLTRVVVSEHCASGFGICRCCSRCRERQGQKQKPRCP